MEKTKLGLSVGLVGALAFLLCLFGGYLPVLLLAGYVLLAEENLDLKKTVVKALVLLAAFDTLGVLINLIPNLFSLLDRLAGLFGGNVQSGILPSLFSLLMALVSYAEQIVFLVFGFLSLKGKAPAVPVLDGLLNKFVD